MVSSVLWALLLYFLYIGAHGVTRILASKGDKNALAYALGSRDGSGDSSETAARCGRAQRNMEESLFFFLPLALLLMITGKADGIGATGALVYLVARAAYLPAYIVSVYALRSVVWTVSVAGLVMMVLRLTS